MRRILGALAALLMATCSAAAQAPNGADLTHAARPLISLPFATRGVVFKTAALNPDGTLASCFACVSSIHLGTGLYQVTFNTNVQAINGWSRWLQVDTLTTGSIANVSCTTADRAGNVDAVFVECTHGNTGALTDTSFFLFVAR